MKARKIPAVFLAAILTVSGFWVSAQAEGIGACTHMAHGRNQEQTCSAAVNAGVPFVRDEVIWQTVESVKGQLSFPERSRWVESATESGINCLVVLSYGNTNYDSGKPSQADLDAGGAWDCTLPVRDGNPETTADNEYFDAYVRYVDFVSKSLAGKVAAYEIWNEPDIKYFNTKDATAGDYTEMLKAAYRTIKNNDPGVTVLGGAIAFETDFIDGMMKAGAGKYMDGLSVHYYLGKGSPEKRARNRLDEYRDVLVKYGYDKMPVWLTETGWANSNVDEQTQAQYIIRNAVFYDEFLLDHGIDGQYFTYELQDSSITADVLAGMEYENSLGLYKNDFTPKVSAGAVKAFNSLTAGKKLTAVEQTKFVLFYRKSAYTATYSQSGQTVYIVWAESEFDMTINLPDAKTTVYDMQGNIIEDNARGGEKRINATQSPVYIVCDSDPVKIERNFMQRVIAFFADIFRMIANGFTGW